MCMRRLHTCTPSDFVSMYVHVDTHTQVGTSTKTNSFSSSSFLELKYPKSNKSGYSSSMIPIEVAP